MAISLSEIIKDALKLQALHQIKQNGVSEEDIERWRGALMDLDAALDQIKGNDGVARSLHQLGHGFNNLVDHILSTALNPDSLSHKVEILEGRASEVRTPTQQDSGLHRARGYR
ncbi:MAG: gas vesicle protein K [Dehalococcoidia bacterium]|nr:gas vesicle protein K [Dehalococcoidia bacterium]